MMLITFIEIKLKYNIFLWFGFFVLCLKYCFFFFFLKGYLKKYFLRQKKDLMIEYEVKKYLIINY